MASTSAWASAWHDYGSTAMYSTGGLGAALGMRSSGTMTSSQYELLRQLHQQQVQQLNGPVLSRGAATPAVEAKKGKSMVDEFRGYIREYKDWIFTIAIIAVVDHFFLDGALKEKLAAALGKKLDASHDAKA